MERLDDMHSISYASLRVKVAKRTHRCEGEGA